MRRNRVDGSTRRPDPSDDERGFALGLALLALLMVTGAVAWGVLLGLYSLRGSRGTVALAQAFSAAEEGVRTQVATADWHTLREWRVGQTAPFAGSVLAGTGWYEGAVVRIGSAFFLVHAEGFDAGSYARQRVGVLVRFAPLRFRPLAALEASGAVEVSDRGRVRGEDAPDVAWDCPAIDSSVAALRVPAEDSAEVSTSGCADGRCLDGDPDVALQRFPRGSPVPDINALKPFVTIALLGGEVVIGPESAGNECLTHVVSNWGDSRAPETPCGQHVPLVYSNGDVTVRGGRGQALLVVQGDLVLEGDTDLSGLVFVYGRLVVRERARFRGAVVVENVGPFVTRVADDATIDFSSCAVKRALAAAAVPAPLRERSWIQLD